MRILLSSRMTGQHVRNAFEAFRTHGMLHSYHTKIAITEGSVAELLLNIPIFSLFRRRLYPKEAKPFIVSYWKDEIIQIILSKIKARSILKKYRTNEYQNALFDKRIVRYIEKHHSEIDAIYTYENTAYNTFKTAKKYGIRCFYELPIGYWREKENIFQSLSRNYPDWIPTLGFISETDEIKKKKDAELLMADQIIVPSTFVKNTLLRYPRKLENIEIIQYGAPVNATSVSNRQYTKEGKLKVLYCGSLTQRKGLADVFTVCNSLRDIVSLTVIGGGNILSCDVLKRNLNNCNYISSVSHDRLLRIMGEHDIFFFPSYFEGFALVIFDAMSQGLPVITTLVTSGPIRDGYDGWIVEPGNVNSIKRLFEHLYLHRDEIEMCSKNACITAHENTWMSYQSKLCNCINSVNI